MNAKSKGKDFRSNSERGNGRGEKDTRRSRGRNSSNRTRSGGHRDDSSYASSTPINDISWYNRNPLLLKDACSLPFSAPLGTSIGYDLANNMNISVPGIYVLHAIPTPGISTNASSPINVAGNKLYTFVRHANSGHTNYEVADLTIYLQAMDSIFSYAAWMMRVYGVSQSYSYSNRYTPEALLEAMNVSYKSVQANQAQLRYYINMYLKKISGLAIPADYSLFKRHIWMFGNYFTDTTSRKPQYYLYNPAGLYRYEGYTGKTGGQLVYEPMLDLSWETDDETSVTTEMDHLFDVNAIMTYGDKLINAILFDEDINIMSGDILKAFGADKLFTWDALPADFTVAPVYSAEILSQIENANVLPYTFQLAIRKDLEEEWVDGTPTGVTAQLNIYQENGIVKFNPAFRVGDSATTADKFNFRYKANNPYGYINSDGWLNIVDDDMGRALSVFYDPKFINMHESEPSPESVMIATRCTMGMGVGPEGTSTDILALGSELILYSSLYYIGYRNGNRFLVIDHPWSESMVYLQENPSSYHFESIIHVSNFDWHPFMRSRISETPESINSGLLGYIGDVDNYTFVVNDVLSRMHEVALISEYTCDSMGQYS